MGRRKHDKPRLIPEQDRRICGTICLCQMTAVLSSVALVYLTVIIYIPSMRAFQAGFIETPVMCQTTKAKVVEPCVWASCGEWCLTKPSGNCTQVLVRVRRHGSRILVGNCTKPIPRSCPPANDNTLTRYNCNDDQCKRITGIFNCSIGLCANISEQYNCNYQTQGNVMDSDKDSEDLNGLYRCNNSDCQRIIDRTFSCERICPSIPTGRTTNIILLHGDDVAIATCKAAKDADTGQEFWRSGQNEKILMASCVNVRLMDDRIVAEDCINGTLLPKSALQLNTTPRGQIHFTDLWKIYAESNQYVYSTEEVLPLESELVIFNETKLLVNFDGCVNTLRGECKTFAAKYGKDGAYNTAPARFSCYYDPNNDGFVVKKFNREETWRDLLIAALLPGTLFIISCITLLICTRTVVVGDDAKMRCKYCGSGSSDKVGVMNEQPEALLARMRDPVTEALETENAYAANNRAMAL